LTAQEFIARQKAMGIEQPIPPETSPAQVASDLVPDGTRTLPPFYKGVAGKNTATLPIKNPELAARQAELLEGAPNLLTVTRAADVAKASTATQLATKTPALRVGLGAHGQVKVTFPDADHAELFSIPGKIKRSFGVSNAAEMANGRTAYPSPEGVEALGKRLGISRDEVYNVAAKYKAKVMDQARAAKAAVGNEYGDVPEILAQSFPEGQ
jgi:hypothetical protein